MSARFDEIASEIDAMDLKTLRRMKTMLELFQSRVLERIQQLENPPALDVSVGDGVKAEDKFGQS